MLDRLPPIRRAWRALALTALLAACSGAQTEPESVDITSPDDAYIRNCETYLDLFLEHYYEVEELRVSARLRRDDAYGNHVVRLTYDTEIESASQFECEYMPWEIFIKRTQLAGYPEPHWRMTYPEAYRHNGRALADEGKSELFRRFVRMDTTQ